MSLRSFPGIFGSQFGILLPGRLQVLPHLAVDHAVDLPVEVDGAFKAGIRSAIVVAVELLHGHAALLNDVLFLDPAADDIRPVEFDEPLSFELADIVDNQRAVLHLRHHALVLTELDAGLLQSGDVLLVQPGLVAIRVRFHVQFFNIAAVRVYFETGQNPPAFVVIPVSKLIARGDGLHADFPEEFLVMMGPGATHKEHGSFALAPGLGFLPRGLHPGHLPGDDRLDLLRQLGVVKIFGDLPQGLGCGLSPDKIDLDPRNAELGFHHLGHVIDGAVAHDEVEVGGMGIGKIVIAGVAAEGGNQRDAAVLEEALDLEGIAADVVFPQHVDFELAFPHRVVQAHHVGEDAVVGDVVAGRLTDAFVALATEAEDIAIAKFLLHLPGHRVHVVTDEAHGAGGEDADGLGFEEVIGLLHRLLQFLLAAEDNLLFLHVRGEAVGHKVMVFRVLGLGLVPAGQPGIEAAADGAMGNVDDIPGGA